MLRIRSCSIRPQLSLGVRRLTITIGQTDMSSRFGWYAVSALVMASAACARATPKHHSALADAAVVAIGDAGTVPSDSAVDQEVRRTLTALYAAFSFDAGAEPDWAAQRALFLPGAAFVDPVKPGVMPRAIGIEEFLANFHRSVVTDPALRAGFLSLRPAPRRCPSCGRRLRAWACGNCARGRGR